MIYSTKNFGQVEVLGDGTKYSYWKVKFLNTGHIDEFRKDAVIKGEIRDKFAVTLCGVGIIGDIKTRGKYKPYYVTWRNMIKRCYDSDNKAYNGVVEVCDRWKTFQFFYEDVPSIEGWDEERFANGELALDKDLKQRFSKSKIYSKETCVWTTKQINSAIQDAQQRKFMGISPSGDKFFSTNITDFARQFGLERKQISAVLHGRFKTTNGWKFQYIEKEIV